MTHIRTLSKTPAPAQQGVIDLAETVIMGLLTIFFNTWDNFPSVIQNLSKYYSKTP